MAQQFFIPGERRAEKVNQLFSTVARRYELMNDLQSFGLHRYWKRKLIQISHAQPGDKALDVCCGTADLALGLARHDAQTVGLDFTNDMLRIAEAKALKANLKSRITFVSGNAEALQFPDNSFDIVTVGYGLRNLKKWETGVREMQR